MSQHETAVAFISALRAYLGALCQSVLWPLLKLEVSREIPLTSLSDIFHKDFKGRTRHALHVIDCRFTTCV